MRAVFKNSLVVNLDEFQEAQKIAARCGYDPYNNGPRIWAAHALLTSTSTIASEYDANKAMARYRAYHS